MSKDPRDKARRKAAGKPAKATAEVVELRSDVSVWKGIALKHHIDQTRAQLRRDLAAWYANLLGEIEHVQHELRDEGSELSKALDPVEANDVDNLLDQAWHKLAGAGRPKCVPAFLAEKVVRL